MYITDLLNEIQTWSKIRKIAKNAESQLKEKGFRVDWIGRIYDEDIRFNTFIKISLCSVYITWWKNN